MKDQQLNLEFYPNRCLISTRIKPKFLNEKQWVCFSQHATGLFTECFVFFIHNRVYEQPVYEPIYYLIINLLDCE